MTPEWSDEELPGSEMPGTATPEPFQTVVPSV